MQMRRSLTERRSLQIGLFTDGLMHLPFEAALEVASRLGVQAVEIGTGNFSPAPHCDLDHLLENAAARKNFLGRHRTASAYACGFELQRESAAPAARRWHSVPARLPAKLCGSPECWASSAWCV